MVNKPNPPDDDEPRPHFLEERYRRHQEHKMLRELEASQEKPTIPPPSRFTRQAPAEKPTEPKKLKRTDNLPKTQSRYFQPPVYSLPNEITAVSIGNIYSRKRKLGYYAKPLTVPYGKNLKIELSGAELNVKDVIVLIALAGLARRYRDLSFMTSDTELVGQLYKHYDKGSKDSVRKSLNRLRHTSIRIIKEVEKESFSIGIVSDLFGKERGKERQFIVVLDPWFGRLLRYEMMTALDLPYLLSLKGDILKQCYIFFQRHTSARKKQDEYEYGLVGLEKFCDWIGYDRDHKLSPKWKRYKIKNAFKQLVSIGYLTWYSAGDLKNNLVNVRIKFREVPKLDEWQIREVHRTVEEIKALPWKREHKEATDEHPKRERKREEDVIRPEEGWKRFIPDWSDV